MAKKLLKSKPVPSKEQMGDIVVPEDTLEEATNKCRDIYKNTTKSVSCRVNSYTHFNYRGEEEIYLPISAVIEAGMIYFLTLTHDERIKFLDAYSAQRVRVKDLRDTEISFEEYIKEFLQKRHIPDSVIKKMNLDDKIEAVLSIMSSEN